MSPRQVILIMTDSQRRDMVGAYGSDRFRTPQLDRLAASGVRFDQAFCVTPVCTPSRSALFSGLPAHQAGAWANQLPFHDTTLTIGQRLADAGIRAAYTGKWHLDGSDYFGTGAAAPGWLPEYWYDMRNYLEQLPEDQRPLSRQLSTIRDHPELVTRDFCFAAGCTDRAVDFLQAHRDRSFLLTVSYDEPHHPWLCPEPYLDAPDARAMSAIAHDPLGDDKPAQIREWSSSGSVPQDKMQAIYACNRFVDDEIGRVLDAIDAHCPEAMVIATSDHGEFFGEHGLQSKGPAMYHPITNIPLLIRAPDIASAPAVCPQIVSHLDLAPTILDYLGLPTPPSLGGSSLLDQLRDPDRAAHEAVFMEFNRFNVTITGKAGFWPIRCAFDGRCKLILNLLDRDELYDLEADPGEIRNLIDDPAYAAQRDGLHARILAWMHETLDPMRGPSWVHRPWATPAAAPAVPGRVYRQDNGRLPPDLAYDTGLPALPPESSNSRR